MTGVERHKPLARREQSDRVPAAVATRHQRISTKNHKQLYQVIVITGLLLSSLWAIGCDRTGAEVEWQVAKDSPKNHDKNKGRAIDQDEGEQFQGFFQNIQQLGEERTQRAIWWDGKRLLNYRNGELLERRECTVEQRGDRSVLLDCMGVPDETTTYIRESTVPLGAIDTNHVFHRAQPKVVYARVPVPGYAKNATAEPSEQLRGDP